MGELIGNLGLFPFMYRGKIGDLNLATKNGYYEMIGSISNAPFAQSWGPLLVFGNTWKIQIAALSTSNGFDLYARSLSNELGWKRITLN